MSRAVPRKGHSERSTWIHRGSCREVRLCEVVWPGRESRVRTRRVGRHEGTLETSPLSRGTPSRQRPPAAPTTQPTKTTGGSRLNVLKAPFTAGLMPWLAFHSTALGPTVPFGTRPASRGLASCPSGRLRGCLVGLCCQYGFQVRCPWVAQLVEDCHRSAQAGSRLLCLAAVVQGQALLVQRLAFAPAVA